jgi:hypothetical protein
MVSPSLSQGTPQPKLHGTGDHTNAICVTNSAPLRIESASRESAHDEKIYMCPLTSCCIRFTTLSELWSYIESGERCVRNTLNGFVTRVGLIGM